MLRTRLREGKVTKLQSDRCFEFGRSDASLPAAHASLCHDFTGWGIEGSRIPGGRVEGLRAASEIGDLEAEIETGREGGQPETLLSKSRNHPAALAERPVLAKKLLASSRMGSDGSAARDRPPGASRCSGFRRHPQGRP